MIAERLGSASALSRVDRTQAVERNG